MSTRLISAIAAVVSFATVIHHEANAGPATDVTREANAAVSRQLDFSDQQAFEDAHRGFIATLPDAEVTDDNGQRAWSNKPRTEEGRVHAPSGSGATPPSSRTYRSWSCHCTCCSTSGI